MSRSYRKFPGYRDRHSMKYGKRQAAKSVRNYKYYTEVSDFCWYKKLYERWNICDYNFRYYSDDEIIRYCRTYNKYAVSIGKPKRQYSEREILVQWYHARCK